MNDCANAALRTRSSRCREAGEKWRSRTVVNRELLGRAFSSHFSFSEQSNFRKMLLSVADSLMGS